MLKYRARFGRIKAVIDKELVMDDIVYCCENFKEWSSGDSPAIEPQLYGEAWCIIADDTVALYDVIYCPFCGQKLPVSNG